jgi:hypothetical protein
MKVISFAFDEGWLKKFLDFPRHLYASDPNWMPDPAEPRLLTGGRSRSMTWRNFLMLEGDEVCGRVTAILNPRLCDEDSHPYGQLGFFECVDDLHAAQLLIDPALRWLREAAPATNRVLAPMNFDTWHPYRLRTKGLDEPTFFMEPYNPPYYPSLLLANGFSPVSRYVTKTVNELMPLLAFWEPYHREMLARGFSIRTINMDALPEELSLSYRMSLAMFRENLFFTDISEAEFRALYGGAAGSLDPDLFLFLLDPSGEPVGLVFSFADPLQPKTVNIKTFGVMPQVRREGAGAGLAYEMYSRFHAIGFTCVNHCLMRAGNRADAFDGGLGVTTREYTLFIRSLGS